MKKSGFAVKITAFIQASATDARSMEQALLCIGQLEPNMAGDFDAIEVQSRFMLSREVPDAVAGSETVSSNEPVAVLDLRAEFGKAMVEVGAPMLVKAIDDSIVGELKMPPIPAAMKRT